VRQLVVASDLALSPDAALERGCEIAAANCADLHVLRLADRRRADAPAPRLATLADDLARRFPCIGTVSVSPQIPCNAKTILKEAIALGAELIVMRNAIDPDQPDDRPFDLIIEVARHGSIPVLAAQGDAAAPYRRILALLDDNGDARQVLDLALQVRSAREIFAVHACPRHATPRQLETAKDDLKRVIAQTLADRSDIAFPVKPIVQGDDLASVLIDQWSALHPDLVVTATHRHHGIDGMFRRSHVADLLEIMPFDLLVTNLDPSSEKRGGTSLFGSSGRGHKTATRARPAN